MKVSVIIPTYNSEDTIGRTLEALLDQDFQEEYEILVVDDGSTDDTEKVVQEYQDKSDKIKFVPQENSGPAAARNTGARKAGGKYILFTDSDCVPEEDWVSEMVLSLEGEGVVGVQGRYKCLNEDSVLARFVQYEVEERYERMKKEEYIDFVGSYSAGYDREIFLDFDGFDEDFKEASGEDPELSYRLDEKGYKMVFNPDAVVKHEHPSSLKDYLKMKFGRGYWGVLLYRKHPEKRGGQSYNSPMFFYHIPFTCVLITLALISLPFSFAISSMVFGLVLISNIPSSIYFSKYEAKIFPVSIFLVLLRNLAFGSGILTGILKIGGLKPY